MKTYTFIISFDKWNKKLFKEYLELDYETTIRRSIIPDLYLYTWDNDYVHFYLCKVIVNKSNELLKIVSFKKFPLE